MNTITGIRELDAYLLMFMDQNTIYNYSLLSRETNQIATGHILFSLLKEYYEKHAVCETMLSWAIINDKPLILDWHTNIGYKFEHAFFFVNLAINYSSVRILDWFYQRNIFDYTLGPLHYVVLNGSVDIIDWFYGHPAPFDYRHLACQTSSSEGYGLEVSYLDKLLSEPGIITKHVSNHRKLLKILKWLYRKKYLFQLDPNKISIITSEDSVELIKWLSDHQLIDKSIFKDERYVLSLYISNLPIVKQLELLKMLRELGYHFKDFENMLPDYPIEVIEWYMENIRHINIIDIFKRAAIGNNVSIVEWTGINKNHPSFNLIDHNFIVEQLLSRNFNIMDMIMWYSKNIVFNDRIITTLIDLLKSMDNLPTDIVILFEQPLLKNHYLHETIRQKICKSAFVHENVPLLEYLTKEYSAETMNIYMDDIAYCVQEGYINTLRWLEKYLNDPDQKIIQIIDNLENFRHEIDEAASFGYFETIKWVKQFFPHKFKYIKAIDHAASIPHIEMLDWFDKMFGNTPEFKYSNIALDETDYCDKIKSLKWFHRTGHPPKYTTHLINGSIRTNIMRLEWLKRNKYPMIFTLKSIRTACTTSTCEALQWLRDNNVIRILESKNQVDLQIFRLELSQPFAGSGIEDVDSMIYNLLDYYFNVKYIDVKYIDNVQNTRTRHVKQDVNRDKKIIEIVYKRGLLEDLLTNSENKEINPSYSRLFGVHNSLCWFERCTKQQNNSNNKLDNKLDNESH